MKRIAILLTPSFIVLATVLAIVSGRPIHAQGPPAANGKYKYIATGTTTMVEPVSGYLHTVTINGGTAGVVTLYDIAAAGCTGTPGSGKFATIAALGTGITNETLTYDLATVNGLCVVTAAATDVTVSFN